MSESPLPALCAACGLPATGLASIESDGVERRYCHGDNDPEPTCYMRQRIDPGDWTFQLSRLIFGGSP